MAHQADYARRILKHYFKMALTSNGLKWDSNCDSEIDGAVDDIIDSVKSDIVEGIKHGKC